ncbi:MAG TPA: hypothetical protein EYP58_04620 [bacterium (Candidatus Stahlbacteria)]|nr:hypothetical protein [Candidatus Stahlbacteria bacterium]
MEPKKLMDHIDNNVGQLKYLTNDKTKFLQDEYRQNQTRYLYPSLIKDLTAIACIIQDNEHWRPPINPADIFILMADNDIIHHHIVPSLKKAIRLASKITTISKEDLFEELTSVIKHIAMCNDAFKVYFQLKEFDSLQ